MSKIISNIVCINNFLISFTVFKLYLKNDILKLGKCRLFPYKYNTINYTYVCLYV